MKKSRLLSMIAVVAGLGVSVTSSLNVTASAASIRFEELQQHCFIDLYQHDYDNVGTLKSKILEDLTSGIVSQNPATEELLQRWSMTLEQKREDIEAREALAPLLVETSYSVDDLQAMAALYSNLSVGISTMMNYYSRESGFSAEEAEKELAAIGAEQDISQLGYDLSPAAREASQPAYETLVTTFDETFADLFHECVEGNNSNAEFSPAFLGSGGSSETGSSSPLFKVAIVFAAIVALLAGVGSVVVPTLPQVVNELSARWVAFF